MNRATAHLSVSGAITLILIFSFIHDTPPCSSFRIRTIYAATYVCIWIVVCFVMNMFVATYYIEAETMHCEQIMWFSLMAVFIMLITSAIAAFLYHQGMEGVDVERKKHLA